MPKYQFTVIRTIGEAYKFVIDADNAAQASDEADDLLANGNLDWPEPCYTHVDDEFIDSIEELK